MKKITFLLFIVYCCVFVVGCDDSLGKKLHVIDKNQQDKPPLVGMVFEYDKKSNAPETGTRGDDTAKQFELVSPQATSQPSVRVFDAKDKLKFLGVNAMNEKIALIFKLMPIGRLNGVQKITAEIEDGTDMTLLGTFNNNNVFAGYDKLGAFINCGSKRRELAIGEEISLQDFQ
ncbi:MAG: hypothetical protein LBD17_01800 [Endomicrobium sp.]|jgi:hypothetical protein|nr:hypothetical protein [Endomicrobium sp.]